MASKLWGEFRFVEFYGESGEIIIVRPPDVIAVVSCLSDVSFLYLTSGKIVTVKACLKTVCERLAFVVEHAEGAVPQADGA